MNKISSNNSINNLYRQYSYSESCIQYIKDNTSNDLEIPLIKNPPIKENIENKKKSNKLFYLLKRFIMFMFHLSLISVFEIFFFFNIVSQYENNALTGLINDFTNKIPNSCLSLNNTQKVYFTKIFNNLVNITDIDIQSQNSYINRIEYNHKLVTLAWTYFGIICAINILLLAINYYFKLKIKLFKIIIDNIFMIIILGLYEFLFFKTIIIKYENTSDNELNKYIINQFDNCLI